MVLIIDKSSSMEGRKMELARVASMGVVENLRPVDSVGVLIFDNSFQWAVPIREARIASLIKRLVAGITPDGGTQIAPALSEGLPPLLPINATFKHIVLLTDGISEEGDSLGFRKKRSRTSVTISTVGLGQDVNRGYLEKVANSAGGKSYFLNDPSGLEQILLKDVMEHTGSTAIEKTLTAAVAKKAEILEGVGMESAPTLKGYVRFIAKPTAETLLTIDREGAAPYAMAVRAGAVGRIHLGREEPMGIRLDRVARIRQVLDQRRARPSSSRAGRRGASQLRRREWRSDHRLSNGYRNRRVAQGAGHLRVRPG